MIFEVLSNPDNSMVLCCYLNIIVWVCVLRGVTWGCFLGVCVLLFLVGALLGGLFAWLILVEIWVGLFEGFLIF